MEISAATYLFALAGVSTTFAGFSAIIMIFRQAAGGYQSPQDTWITLVFIQLGFLVTAGSLSAPLLGLCGVPLNLIWQICSGIIGVVVAAFAASYPTRRRAVTGTRSPAFVWIDLILLAICAMALLSNAIGRPLAPNPGSFAFGLTGMLFTAGVGYLHALGSLHKETKRAGKETESPPNGC